MRICLIVLLVGMKLNNRHFIFIPFTSLFTSPPPFPFPLLARNMSTHKHTNRLVQEKSPYLLQHAHNPVNWYVVRPSRRTLVVMLWISSIARDGEHGGSWTSCYYACLKNIALVIVILANYIVSLFYSLACKFASGKKGFFEGIKWCMTRILIKL